MQRGRFFRRLVGAFALLGCCAACAAGLPALPPPPPAQPVVLEPEPPTPTLPPANPVATGAPASPAETDPVRVGILHSLSGTMAFEETPPKNAALMAIEEINRAGGVLGRQLEPVVVDPASNWPLFAEKAHELLQKEKSRVVFGAHTSVSRKSILPVLEELNGLLLYPAQHEGEESSASVFYTGSVPNQSVSVVADYLAQRAVRPIKRWFVIGTDYVIPRTQAKVLSAAWRSAHVPDDDVVIVYTPFGHTDYQAIVGQLRRLTSRGPTAVLSLLFGESNVAFQKELLLQHVSPRTTSVVSFGLDERALENEGALFAGIFVARSYFSVIESPANAAFKRLVAKYASDHSLPPESFRLNDDVEATYVGVNLWKQAVESAKSFETPRVSAALANQTFAAPSGFTVRVDPRNHHLQKPYFLAEVGRKGSVTVVWKTPEVVLPLAPEPALPTR